jgi:hypothetical protein
MRSVLVTVVVLLIAAASAFAGGFATVELRSLPDGTAPGEPWVVDMKVLAHGRSEAPVDELSPSVEVVKADGSARRTFPAKPTGQPGVYRARVVFESAGSWRYSIDDGYSAIHSYPPVQVGAGSAPAQPAASPAQPAASPPPDEGSSGGPNVLLALSAALLAGLAAGLVTRLLARPSSAGRPAEA